MYACPSLTVKPQNTTSSGIPRSGTTTSRWRARLHIGSAGQSMRRQLTDCVHSVDRNGRPRADRLLRTDRPDCAAGVQRYKRAFYCTGPHQWGRVAQRGPTGAEQANGRVAQRGPTGAWRSEGQRARGAARANGRVAQRGPTGAWRSEGQRARSRPTGAWRSEGPRARSRPTGAWRSEGQRARSRPILPITHGLSTKLGAGPRCSARAQS